MLLFAPYMHEVSYMTLYNRAVISVTYCKEISHNQNFYFRKTAHKTDAGTQTVTNSVIVTQENDFAFFFWSH